MLVNTTAGLHCLGKIVLSLFAVFRFYLFYNVQPTLSVSRILEVLSCPMQAGPCPSSFYSCCWAVHKCTACSKAIASPSCNNVQDCSYLCKSAVVFCATSWRMLCLWRKHPFLNRIDVHFILKGIGPYKSQDIQKPGQAHGSSNRRPVSPVQETIQRLGRSQW